MNEYTNIAEYYDLLITNGYYDHQEMAMSFASLIDKNQKILEVGVGTGLFLEKLLAINPQYDLTGIDHTPEMLAIARERLGNSAKLIEADIFTMELPDTFDIAVSVGGLCAFVDTGSERDLYTHFPDYKQNLQALKNIAQHLRQGGLFFINIQGVHKNYDITLPHNIVYSQEISELTNGSHQGCIEKKFFFKQKNELLAQQTLIYRIFKGDLIEKIMNEAGFELKSQDQSQKFLIYSKK